MDVVSRQHIKGYELQDRIGAGGFGAVYKAYQSTVGREVAIKVILPGLANQPDFIRRFESEAQLVARLEHPYITPLYDYWRDPDGAYLVMRWLRGGSLEDALQNGPFELRAAALLLDQIAGALSLAHRSGVIHRDIKPANILLDEDSNAYLTDFGIAKDLNLSGNNTQPDTIVGSLDYISPEQARSEPVTARTDIYSLGVTLFEMLTGHHPFENVSAVERLYKHINDPMPKITSLEPGVQEAVNRVIQKATAKNPDHRYPDALAFAADFREAVGMNRTSTTMIELLTQREHEVLSLIIEGLSNKEIAQRLTVTLGTVKWYVNQIYSKLGVRSRVQAIIRARELNLLTRGADAQEIVSIPTEDFRPENPYKGLRAFTAADHKDFFGREKLTQKLLKKLEEPGEFARFLAVVGPSGSGKSSLVKAGLIPAIWKGALPQSEKWFVVETLPGSLPLDELEIALTKVAANQSGNLNEHLRRDENGLVRAAQLILPNDGSELLLVIDQFEEIFTLVEDEPSRQHFLNLLHAAVVMPRSRVRVVVTLRADFYDRPLHYPHFGELIRSRMETILPLSAEELERAVAEPAKQEGVTFEAGLVSTIVADVKYQPAALPLLQYALTELFEQRKGRLLLREAYQAIGGTVGALAKRAEEIYQSLDEAGKETARQMFLRLVTLGEGAEDTRRRTSRAELLAITPDTDLMEEVIDTYAEYRLLSLDNDPGTRQPTVEVAHEAILREWERLRGWLNESREEIKLQRQLSGLVTDWNKADQEISYLVGGARLTQMETWAKTTELTLTPDEKKYLQASITARTKHQSEEIARQERENRLEQRARRFLYVLAIGSFVAAILAIGLSIFAFTQQREAQRERDAAQRQADENQSLVWAFQARSLNDSNTPLALRLALESISIDNPPPVAQSIARDIAQDDSLRHLIRAHVQSIQSVAVNKNGTIAVTGSCGVIEDTVCLRGELAVWDLGTGNELWRIASHQGWVNAIVMTPDETSIIAGGCGIQDAGQCVRGDLIEYDLMTGDVLQTIEIHDDGITALQYHPTAQSLWIGTADGMIKIWRSDDETITLEVSHHAGPVVQIAFSPMGTYALSGDTTGNIIHWNTNENTLIQSIEAHSNAITGLILFDDQTAITASLDFTIKRWNLETSETLETLTTGDSTSGLLLSPNDDSIYILRLLAIRKSPISNLANEQDRFMREWYPFDFHPDNDDEFGAINTAALARDTPVMLVGHGSGLLAMWVLETVEPTTIIQGSAYVEMAIHPHGTQMALGTLFGTLEIWDIDPNSPTYLTLLYNVENDLAGAGLVDYNADGSQIVWGVADYFNTQESALYIVDSETGEIVQTFDTSQHVNTVRAVTFMANNSQIVSGSQPLNVIGDSDLIIWDIESGDVVHQFMRDVLLADVTDIAVVDDNRLLLSGAGFERVRLFNIATGEVEQTFDAAHSSFGVQYLPQSDQIFSGTSDGIAVLWDAQTTETHARIEVQSDWMYASDISPNEQYAIVASDSQSPALLDLETGTIVQIFPRHQADNVWGVAFSPDGQSVWTADMAGAVYQWQIEDETLTGNELVSWIRENRYILEPTCDVRELYRIEPLCDAATP